MNSLACSSREAMAGDRLALGVDEEVEPEYWQAASMRARGKAAAIRDRRAIGTTSHQV
jgi:hypothetical protein